MITTTLASTEGSRSGKETSGFLGQWLLKPHHDPAKAARGAALADLPANAQTNCALIYSANWQWLSDLLGSLPARNGRLLQWFEDGKDVPFYPVKGAVAVRITTDGRLWHSRRSKSKNGSVRPRWERQPYFVTQEGMWRLIRKPAPNVLDRRYPERLVTWIEQLELDPIGVLSAEGRKSCECAVCGRPLREGSGKGIGPECIGSIKSLLNLETT